MTEHLLSWSEKYQDINKLYLYKKLKQYSWLI